MTYLIQQLQVLLSVAGLIVLVSFSSEVVPNFRYRGSHELVGRLRAKRPRSVVALLGIVLALLGTVAASQGGVLYYGAGVFLIVVGLYVAIGVFSTPADPEEAGLPGPPEEAEAPAYETPSLLRDRVPHLGAIFALLLSGVLGLPTVAYGISEGWSKTPTFIALSFLLAMSSAICTGLFGFIFSIRRRSEAIAPGKETQAAATGAVVAANTNLEEVSDWLTKAIIIIGLIEFPNITSVFSRIATFWGERGVDWGQMGVFYAYSLLICFGIAGFVVTYLLCEQLWANLDQQLSADEQHRAAKDQH